jgi:hypothetical protein
MAAATVWISGDVDIYIYIIEGANMRTADAFSAQTPKAQFEPQSSTAVTRSRHTGMCGFQPSLARTTQIHNYIYI